MFKIPFPVKMPTWRRILVRVVCLRSVYFPIKTSCGFTSLQWDCGTGEVILVMKAEAAAANVVTLQMQCSSELVTMEQMPR